jgi:hypothetical protein
MGESFAADVIKPVKEAAPESSGAASRRHLAKLLPGSYSNQLEMIPSREKTHLPTLILL